MTWYNELNLFEFGVENSHKNYNGQTEEGKSSEGQVPEYPKGRPRSNVGVGVKKADTAGGEKNQP